MSDLEKLTNMVQGYSDQKFCEELDELAKTIRGHRMLEGLLPFLLDAKRRIEATA